MHKTLLVWLFALFATSNFAHSVEIDREDFIKIIVSSYVHGFNEFDTSVTSQSDSVSVGIYYDTSTQKEERAHQLANRFRSQLPKLLSKYSWAKDVSVTVSVYSEDRTGRGY